MTESETVTAETSDVSSAPEAVGTSAQAKREDIYETSSDGQYTYFLDGDGVPARVSVNDLQTAMLSGETDGTFGREEAARKAEDLFDQVFAEAARVKGRKKETVVEKLDNTWDATVYLLEDGVETGYMASFYFSPGGILISANYNRGAEAGPELFVTKEQAILLAQEALLAECRRIYGEEAVVYFEKAREISCRYQVIQHHFWSVEFNVPAENTGQYDNSELYAVVRIDSQTGECLAVWMPVE